MCPWFDSEWHHLRSASTVSCRRFFCALRGWFSWLWTPKVKPGVKPKFTRNIIIINQLLVDIAAPGYRSNGEGALWYVGHHGFSWSSATNGILGLHLVFNVTGLYPSSAGYRDYGFQLRCLSE